MSSVDGRLLNGRWTAPFGESTEADLRKVYAAIGKSLQTDAWMFGRNTVQEGFFPTSLPAGKKNTICREPATSHPGNPNAS